MIRKLLYSAFILFAVPFYSFGQTTPYLKNLQIIDSCIGQNNSYPVMAIVKVENYIAGLTVDFHWGDGRVLQNALQYGGEFYESHNYALPGTYSVAAVLMNGNTAVDTLMQSFNNICSMVHGISYLRNDQNCTLDFGEKIINAPYSIQLNENGIPKDTFQVNGSINYKIEQANLTSEYSLKVIAPPPGLILACPTSTHLFKLDTINYFNNYRPTFNFGFDCDPNYSAFDLSVTGTGFFRPVANSHLSIYPRSSSCSTQAAIVTLQLSPKYSLDYSSPTPSSISGNTITWEYPGGITSVDFNSISVFLNPVGTHSLGDTVMNTITITPITGDTDPANNSFVMVDSIKSSFDPNDKHVQPDGPITPGTALTYTINFENLGNDTAFNVHILDTLSESLDLETFKVLSSSAHVGYQVFESTSGSVLRLNFEDILLPGSEDAPKNTGFVTYQINAHANLAAGTVIDNSASIYFDINPPVMTNATRNIIPTPQGITKNEAQKEISIYPNPALDQLLIENPCCFQEVRVTNALGQVVIHQKISKGVNNLSIESWPSGLYFLEAFGDKGKSGLKFIKK